MRRILIATAVACWLVVSPASAAIQLGATAPNFTKNKLGGGSFNLADYSGKVVVIFLLGWT